MRGRFVGAALTVLLAAACAESREPTPAEIDAAVAELRQLYSDRDFVAGVRLALDWLEQAPGEPELLGLGATHLAALGEYHTVLEIADGLAVSRADDPWTRLAHALALQADMDRDEEALEQTAAALSGLPDDPLIARLALTLAMRFDGPEKALEVAGGLSEAMWADPAVLSGIGYVRWANQYMFRDDPDAAKVERDSGIALQDEALRRAPDDPQVLHQAAMVFYRSNRYEEASGLFERAIVQSPYDRTSHTYYWAAISQRADLEQEEKEAIITESAEKLLAARGDSPHTLRTIAGGFGQIEATERQVELEDRVLEIAPASLSAEWVLTGRIRRDQSEMYEAMRAAELDHPDPAQSADLRAQLEAYIARPGHLDQQLLGAAYRNLFMLIEDDPEVDPAHLVEVVEGMVEHEEMNVHIVYPRGSRALAERTTEYRRAEEIARLGIDAANRQMEMLRSNGIYSTQGEFEEARDFYLAMMRDAIGWVWYNEGRLDEAEEELMAASELADDKLMEPLYHLGRVHERRYENALAEKGIEALELGDEESRVHLERAETFYARGVNVQRPGDNPSDAALLDLYVRLYDTEEGYDEYLAEIVERDRVQRKAEILAERIEDPRSAPAFSLASLDGGQLSLDELAGKVVAINFWGIWCGPCVIEMPEFQEFHEAYRDDPDIVVLTIDTEDVPEELAEWMGEKSYDFGVLLDDGYVQEANITSFPTTWFIDREGRIAFIKKGTSLELAEEFGWRVEALRGSER